MIDFVVYLTLLVAGLCIGVCLFRPTEQKPNEFHIIIVGISGKIGSGKTTLAKNLKKLLEARRFKVYERSFADELKQAVAREYKFDVQLCYSQEGKNVVPNGCNVSVGRLLQQYGTAQREINPSVWIDAVDDFIIANSEQEQEYIGKVFIVPDVRFENEAEWLSESNVLVRLNGDPQRVFENTTRDKNHISETALDNYDGFDLVINTDFIDEGKCANETETVVLEKLGFI